MDSTGKNLVITYAVWEERDRVTWQGNRQYL
jgi:hypothetical protein